MNTTVPLDHIPGRLFRPENAGELIAWLEHRRLCLTLADLADERARRGFGDRR